MLRPASEARVGREHVLDGRAHSTELLWRRPRLLRAAEWLAHALPHSKWQQLRRLWLVGHGAAQPLPGWQGRAGWIALRRMVVI